MNKDGGPGRKPSAWRRPRLSVLVLMVAAAFGTVGVAWSHRELLTPADRGVLVEGPLDTDTQSRVHNATVRWRFDPDGASGPEIVADIAVPERRQNIRFSIRRNTDDQLPASHIVEILAEPPVYPGRRIAIVPVAYLKDAPDARGRRLIGAAVTVAADRFWIALSSERFDVNANLDLILGGEVFEFSMAYDTGRSAALLFEKGTTGTRAFEEASAMWVQ